MILRKTRNIGLFLIFGLMGLVLTAKDFPDSWKDGKYYEVNGSKIWTVSFGKGDPIFFVAGGPGYSHLGMRTFDSLSTTNTLIYFDGFGRGMSDVAKSVSEYSLERDIDDLEELRRVMGYKKITVLGHSYGGVVAQGYAIKYPENTRNLILVGSFHSYLMWQENCDNANREVKVNYPEVWDSLMIVRKQGIVSSDPLHQKLYGRVPFTFLYTYSPDNFKPRKNKNKKKPPYPNTFNDRLYYHLVGRDGDFELSGDLGEFDHRLGLKKLKMPILVIGGRYDRVAVPRMMVQFKEYCPNSRYVMFEKSGHVPQVEEPQALFKLIREFLVQKN